MDNFPELLKSIQELPHVQVMRVNETHGDVFCCVTITIKRLETKHMALNLPVFYTFGQLICFGVTQPLVQRADNGIIFAPITEAKAVLEHIADYIKQPQPNGYLIDAPSGLV